MFTGYSSNVDPCAGGPAEGPGGGGGGAELPHTQGAAGQVPRLRAPQAGPRGEQAGGAAAAGRPPGPPEHGPGAGAGPPGPGGGRGGGRGGRGGGGAGQADQGHCQPGDGQRACRPG